MASFEFRVGNAPVETGDLQPLPLCTYETGPDQIWRWFNSPSITRADACSRLPCLRLKIPLFLFVLFPVNFAARIAFLYDLQWCPDTRTATWRRLRQQPPDQHRDSKNDQPPEQQHEHETQAHSPPAETVPIVHHVMPPMRFMVEAGNDTFLLNPPPAR